MADINVNFLHPTDGRQVVVEIDDSITAQEAISELISNEFISPNPAGYHLAIKGGDQLGENESFEQAGVENNTVLRIIPATDAG